MAVDKRLPAVYVDIEDKSYASEPIEAGRTAYVVIISDRGPHNKVVELNSRQDLYDLFGTPNFAKFGHGHYLADQHLKRSGKLYVVRPVILEPMDGMTQDDCAAIANRYIRLNTGSNTEVVIDDNFIVNPGTNVLEPTDPAGQPEQCPKAYIELNDVTIQPNVDYLEFKIGSTVDQLIITPSIYTQMITLAGYTDNTKHIWVKYNVGAINTIECELVPDTANGIDCATTPLEYCNYHRPYDTLVTPLSYYASYMTSPASAIPQSILEFPNITSADISLYDKIENVKADSTGVGNEAVFDAMSGISAETLVIDNSNINAIKSTAGYNWITNGCTINVNTEVHGHLTLTITSGPTANFAHNPMTINTAGPVYRNYIPSSITGTMIPYIPAIPSGLTAGSVLDLNVGDVIFKSGEDPTTADKYTVVSIDEANNQAILDRPVTFSYYGSFSKFVELETKSIQHMTSVKNIDKLDDSILWTFHVVGAGKYYNNIFIKGVRNSTYDRMYTDADGNPEYPYTFMDIAIYRDNGDNTTTLLEGPWTVSLIDKTSKEVIIKDIYTGLQLYLPMVINRKSKIIRVEECRAADSMVTLGVESPYQPDTDKRILLQNLISGKIPEYPDGIRLDGGSDGNMFDSVGRLIVNDNIKAIVMRAYNGSLPSEDGSVEKLMHIIYPWYYINYIYVGGWDHNINFAAKEMADLRKDCLLLSDTGSYMESHSEEIEARRTLVPWNTWNAALYTNYRKIFDPFTSKYFWITPVYHAIDRHLYVDDMYWIADPVAGIEKGAIEEAIELAYSTNETQLADEIDSELNPVIIEPDGTYILQQFTTYKRLSVLKRQHVVKFVHYCKQQLPKILKDVLFRKATNYWISQAEGRVNSFMSKFLDKGDTDRYAAITSYTANCSFDEETSELNVILTIHPIRAIERISVNIIVK